MKNFKITTFTSERKINISGESFANALENAILNKKNFNKCVFDNLSNANLSNGNFVGTTFNGSLCNVDFIKADLRKTKMPRIVSNCNFSDANIVNVNWRGCIFENCTFNNISNEKLEFITTNNKPYADLTELNDKILVKVEGMENGSDEVVFTLDNGLEYLMYHAQDCCESVYLEDVCGDVEDLLYEPITITETSNFDREKNESQTWTFYTLNTKKGSVTLRWLGESNGYYSESVDFARIG